MDAGKYAKVSETQTSSLSVHLKLKKLKCLCSIALAVKAYIPTMTLSSCMCCKHILSTVVASFFGASRVAF